MDLEHLNKTQIILLTLLVSFVTSIATGIVTVSLVNQAPAGVTATVNRIVEHTVEKVVPAPSQAAAPIVTTEKTVVVKDDDLTAQSIAKVRQSVIRLMAKGDKDELLVARGVIIDTKGVAMSDKGSLSSDIDYIAILPGGERVPASVRANSSTTTSIAILDLALATTTPKLIPATFSDPAKLQLGQSVIRIGGKGPDMVGVGVIAALPPEGENGRMVVSSVSSATAGAVLMTIFGEVVGITTSDSLKEGSDYYSAPNIFKVAAASTDATNAASAAGAAPKR